MAVLKAGGDDSKQKDRDESPYRSQDIMRPGLWQEDRQQAAGAAGRGVIERVALRCVIVGNVAQGDEESLLKSCASYAGTTGPSQSSSKLESI